MNIVLEKMVKSAEWYLSRSNNVVMLVTSGKEYRQVKECFGSLAHINIYVCEDNSKLELVLDELQEYGINPEAFVIDGELDCKIIEARFKDSEVDSIGGTVRIRPEKKPIEWVDAGVNK